ncbi:stage V sporulation protein B [Haloimpatiens sp. FM7315]|uniref:stage V sporulation protein B n=1 Tax=Haloimpatiens sp. FM7315 TaxID=3298609 RepID=UPI00370C80B4
MIKDNFFRNSLILTSSNFITGVLKFLFAIILSHKLGDAGIGLYSLIMPIYDFFAVIVCGGMITAISKECSYYFNKNDIGNLHKSVKVSLVFDLIWSVIMALILFSFSPFICKFIIKDMRAMYSLWFICPAIIFVALSAILKGYFYGISKVLTPSVIDIFEKAMRMIVILLIISILNLKETTKTVSVTYLALSLGELCSFILLFLFYKYNKKHFSKPYSILQSGRNLLYSILKISLPLCINGVLTTGLFTASTLMLPQRLVYSGISHENALALIGKFSGMSMTIIFFPFIAVTSMSTMLIPHISENIAKKNYVLLKERFLEVINISFILGTATMFICLSIGQNLGQLFFKRADLAPFIKFASLCAPFIYTSTSTFGILNGLGKQKIVLRNSLISAFLELLLIYLLAAIPKLNIYGYGISLILTSITTLILNLYEIRKNYYIHISFYKIVIYLLLGLLTYLSLNILNTLLHNVNFYYKNFLLVILGFSMYIFLSSLLNSSKKNAAKL